MIARPEHNNAKYFIGSEIEHTGAFSKKTLFLIGEQQLTEIIALAKEHKIPHIFLTGNQSYNNNTDYNILAKSLLDAGYWVTLDYPLEAHQHLLKNLSQYVWQHRLFVPMVSCKLNNLDKCGNNLTVKIDDNFNGSNGGVWCWNRQALLDSNRFTSWDEYAADVVVGTTVEDAGLIESVADSIMQTAGDIKDSVTGAFVGIVQQVADNYVAGAVKEDKVDEDNNITEESITTDVVENIEEPEVEVVVNNEVDENVANTTSVSVDASDISTEPELVAKKSVKNKK